MVRDKPVDIAFRIDHAGTYEWKCPTITPPPIQHASDDVVSQEALDQQNPLKRLYAIPAAEYDAFLEANDPNVPAHALDLGKKLYEKKGCIACHTIDGTARVGPTWKGIWGTSVTSPDGTTRVVDEKFVEESVLTPQAFLLQGYPPAMPSFEGQLKPSEIAALITFIKSLE